MFKKKGDYYISQGGVRSISVNLNNLHYYLFFLYNMSIIGNVYL